MFARALADPLTSPLAPRYAAGGSLRQQLNDNWGPLPSARAASCTFAILSGLRYGRERSERKEGAARAKRAQRRGC
jgi:hypothetical protein